MLIDRLYSILKAERQWAQPFELVFKLILSNNVLLSNIQSRGWRIYPQLTAYPTGKHRWLSSISPGAGSSSTWWPPSRSTSSSSGRTRTRSVVRYYGRSDQIWNQTEPNLAILIYSRKNEIQILWAEWPSLTPNKPNNLATLIHSTWATVTYIMYVVQTNKTKDETTPIGRNSPLKKEKTIPWFYVWRERNRHKPYENSGTT